MFFVFSFIKQKFNRVIEAVLVAAFSATCACVMIYLINDCRPLGNDPTLSPVQMCKFRFILINIDNHTHKNVINSLRR